MPLLAVYTLHTFAALPLFLASAVLAYVGVGFVQDRTLVYGRRRLLVCLALGAVLPVANSTFLHVGSAYAHAAPAVFGTIIPGMAAYNFRALDPEDRLADLAVCLGIFVCLLAVGAAMVAPALATRIDPTLTSMLFTPSSDVAHLRGAVSGTVAHTTPVPHGLFFALALAGIVLSEAANARWGIRTGGLVAVPLLVVFSLSSVWVVPVYLLGVGVTYVSLRLTNSLTIVYGRALLTVALITAFGYGLLVAVSTTAITGYLLYFTSLLAGVGAYNVHVVAPAERSHAIAVAGGLFGLLLAGCHLFVEPTDAGITASITPLHVFVLLAVTTFAGVKMCELERRRHLVTRYHARGAP